jgi:hypothetical protein
MLACLSNEWSPARAGAETKRANKGYISKVISWTHLRNDQRFNMRQLDSQQSMHGYGGEG